MSFIQTQKLSASSLLITALLVGCGGGGGGGDQNGLGLGNVNVATTGGTTGGTTETNTGVSIALLQDLETIGRTINGQDFYWACNASRRFNPVGYIIAVLPDFSFTSGTWLADVDVVTDTFDGSERFTLIGGSENSVFLDYEEIGVIEEITNISFTSSTAWVGFSSTEGELECFADIVESSNASSSFASRSRSEIRGAAASIIHGSDEISISGSDGSSGKLTN